MLSNEKIVREFCAAAEAKELDIKKCVSLFSEDGYMWDMASGTKFRGQAIGDSISGLASGFPDVHREIFHIHATENVVIVELAIRGTQASTGKKIDVPSCDVFHLENGKIKSFHCYNEASVMQRQLGVK